MTTKNILPDLLSSWEETYKKGQLTLWIFLALKDGQKYVDEIKKFIETKSNNTINCEEQSLYRNLRKYQHIDVVSLENKKGNKGIGYFASTPASWSLDSNHMQVSV